MALPQQQGAPGIDIETIAQGHALDAILQQTMDEGEAKLIAGATRPDIVASLCFSAKEALFKALYPTVGRYFGFAAAQVQVLPANGNLRLHLTETLNADLPKGRAFDLRYEVTATHVLTWIIHQSL